MPGKSRYKKPVPSSSAAATAATGNSGSGSGSAAKASGGSSAAAGESRDITADRTVINKLYPGASTLNVDLVRKTLSKVSPTVQDLRMCVTFANAALVKLPKLVTQYDKIIEILLNSTLSDPTEAKQQFHCYPAFQWGSKVAVERFKKPDISILQLVYALITLSDNFVEEAGGFRQAERMAGYKELAVVVSQKLQKGILKADLISCCYVLVEKRYGQQLFEIFKPYFKTLELDDLRGILKAGFQHNIPEAAIAELLELTKQERFDKNQQAALWQECLRWAITASQPVTVRKLLQEKMANVNLGCYRFLDYHAESTLLKNVTPLALAIFNHQAKNAGQVVDVLLSFDADTSGICEALEIDVASTDSKFLTEMRNASKVSEDIYDYKGIFMAPGKNSIINLTAASGSVVLMQKILARTPTGLNTPAINSRTPLITAAAFNQVKMVFYLTQQGADPSPVNSDGMTALQIAEQVTENTAITKLLRDAEKNYAIKNSDSKAADNKHHVSSATATATTATSAGQPVLLDMNAIKEKIFAAIRTGDLPTFRSLYARAYVDWRDLFDNTALHIACAFGQNKIAKDLLEVFKVDVNVENIRGRTPLHLACAIGNEELITLLVKNGADSLAADKEGNTPLTLLIDYRKRQLGKNIVDKSDARRSLESDMVKRFLKDNPTTLHAYTTTQGKLLGFATEAEMELAMQQDAAAIITVMPVCIPK